MILATLNFEILKKSKRHDWIGGKKGALSVKVNEGHCIFYFKIFKIYQNFFKEMPNIISALKSD